jgi:EAL domain-containing protein (putative c-di-GMP-specific phosphodiesterase class I)/DNA-binding response OmpR family regulator
LVLVVDDDADVREFLVASLETSGYSTVQAASGLEALDALDAVHGSIAAVVLDNRLPDVSGLEVLRLIRERPSRATLPVLLVTGDDRLAQRVAGLGAGATDYLVKPVEPDELVARVAAHLRSQAAWFDILDRQLRDRAELVSGLFSIAPRASAEETADAICEQLVDANHVDGAAVTRFDQRGRLSILASRGQHAIAATLHHLTSAPPAYLLARADEPWIERTSGAAARLTDVALAPMRLGGLTVGLFALAAFDDPRRGRREGHQLLAEAIDFAGVATGLLGLSLHARTEYDRRRQDLVDIVDRRQFRPTFQPMVDLTDGTVIGYEALTRFDDGTSPDRRFAEASRLGLGIDLELATIATAIEASSALPDSQFLSLNVTPKLVVEHGTEVGQLLRDARRSIVLELTEHDVVEDYVALRAALDALEPSVRVSIDDAGAGFASLRHVIMLRPEFVKLDRSWVSGIDADPTRQAMVAGLSHFARATGCELVAEGIEEEAERATLADLDVTFGQGFLLGLPSSCLPTGR